MSALHEILGGFDRNRGIATICVGANSLAQIDDAVASLDIVLTDEEAALLEAPYTPRYDFQGVSDPAVLARISAQVGIRPAA